MTLVQLKRLALGVLVVSALAGIALEVLAVLHVFHPGHGEGWVSYWYHHAPPFSLAMGFVGCTVIVYVSKWLGKLWLQRPPDYYGDEEDGDA
ncbi:MAG: hypothetical protein D6729_07370 [Deltaproteobacteria bacterium]|nr:MAG: hypothetical protein D6729_07370 [Deltaproteobacteria bacterium]